MNSIFITNKGKRKTNQDVVFTKSLGKQKYLYLLADGMGGYENGEYAANFITAQLYELLRNIENIDKDKIQMAINTVTEALANENEKQNLNMGATLGGVYHSENRFHCFWVGDVKIKYVKDDKVIYESIEHNLKNELIENQVFVEANNAKKFNHIVTRSIHKDIQKAKIDYKCIDDFEQGNFIILASDGVTDVLDNYQLMEILNSKKDIPDILSELNKILLSSAKDNYSIILIY